MAWLVVLLLCLGRVEAQFPDISDRGEHDTERGLLSLIFKLRHEEVFDTLLVYGEDCVFHSLIRSLDLPTVLVSSGSTNFDWDFTTLTLILSCGPEAEEESTYRTLIKLQRNRRLIYLQEDIQPSSVCERYSQREQFNIAMVRKDFGKSGIVYACRVFQDRNFEEVSLTEQKPIYVENFRNMRGTAIRVVADLRPHRSMVYRNANRSDMKVKGYVANLVNNFADKVNATLHFDLLPDELTLKEIARRAQNDELDIGISVEFSLMTKNTDTTSYPYLFTSYCLMAPVPAKLPYNQVYAMIVDRLVLAIIFVIFCLLSVLLIYSKNMSWRDLKLSNVLLNDISLRGLLGQSHPFPSNANKQLRMIFCILCFASIMLTTMYDAYLQSFFTDPPSGFHFRSFEDFAKVPQKLAINALEAKVMINTGNELFLGINKDYLAIFDNWQEAVALRNAFNTSYYYVVTGERWRAYAEQQSLFKEPLFYFAKDLCFSQMLFMSIPLRRHLPYRHLFEEHMQRQHEFGLVNYWRGHSFFDMVRLGLAPLKDPSQPRERNPSIVLDDVSWVMNLYLLASLVSICCFLLEVGGERWRRWRRSRG
ncbi:uncharacterized protein LOC108101793 [Drosophila ficusphila]|uniref:uncharacterized protein LOC108101793 n=1 Tax=Drosophila ficusphila TaxID=30025 RepID=UPI0007E7F954|nr:uncharacterized protein LOC108101793 [Drosophila ficusphila]